MSMQVNQWMERIDIDKNQELNVGEGAPRTARFESRGVLLLI